jgi:N6-adenosine-specific RNA methylase IME4
MTQIPLLEVPAPILPQGIDLYCCDVAVLASKIDRPPALIVADPPWSYDISQVRGTAANEYQTISNQQIVKILSDAWGYAAPDSRLAVWCTWPKLQEWMAAVGDLGRDWRWRYVTGGSWHKSGSPGVGYHWLGNSEFVMIFAKGTPRTTRTFPVVNAHTSRRQAHSEKPADWMAEWLERWTDAPDLVVDLFAGLAPLARSCMKVGRDYAGAEIDPARHRQAVDRIALYRP